MNTKDKIFSNLFVDLHLSNHLFLTLAQDYPFKMLFFFLLSVLSMAEVDLKEKTQSKESFPG